jgi:hypothetical protein
MEDGTKRLEDTVDITRILIIISSTLKFFISYQIEKVVK